MTREEALKKIEELKKYINAQEWLEDDEIFLLSIDEYKKYKDAIPGLWRWWLRTPSGNQDFADIVLLDGSVCFELKHIENNVRPALRIARNNLQIGSRFVKYDFPWIKIDDYLAIAEVPIGFEKFDDKSNDYATSHIRVWLKEWLDGREND